MKYLTAFLFFFPTLALASTETVKSIYSKTYVKYEEKKISNDITVSKDGEVFDWGRKLERTEKTFTVMAEPKYEVQYDANWGIYIDTCPLIYNNKKELVSAHWQDCIERRTRRGDK